MSYNCVSPSCGHAAIPGGQYCNAHVHGGAPVAWYMVTRPDGSRVNVRATSQEAAEAAVASWKAGAQ